ncbi:UPF0184 protein C9orf16 [Chelonia mydas]|uniref:UPF0184 protein C9orf16 n=1 Tax=Chelonia mydas TaxID=8469 RepID=M7C170_CHEMY|nr:UPF0184 protein C9orf16 [Chelonia mydas]
MTASGIPDLMRCSYSAHSKGLHFIAPFSFPPAPTTSAAVMFWNSFQIQYAAINSMLDQINSCLDHLEEKNDHLHARLKELLESNRQTRLEFQQQLSEGQNMQTDVQGPHTDI